MKSIVKEMQDLGQQLWCSFKSVLTKKTVQMGAMGWIAGVLCNKYGCDQSKLAAWGLTAIAMLQQAAKDFGATAKK